MPQPRRAFHARKALGQHFLVDDEILQRIAEAAEVGPEIAVLEIGAGTGQLSEKLVRTGAKIAAVEIDEDLCRELRRRFRSEPAVQVVCANVLDHAPHELLAEAGLSPPYVVAGNIPYYITAPILRRLLEASVQPERLILTVQREVAESIAAEPGGLSLLAVSVQFYGTARVLIRVPPSSFRPPPKVDSAVMRIDVGPQPRVDVANREEFFDVVRAGFRAPRKQLHNALSQGLWMPPDGSLALLREAAIDPGRRAQTLTLEEWRSLYLAYSNQRPSWHVDATTLPGSKGKTLGPRTDGQR